jgi:hypothetical protein
MLNNFSQISSVQSGQWLRSHPRSTSTIHPPPHMINHVCKIHDVTQFIKFHGPDNTVFGHYRDIAWQRESTPPDQSL